MQIGGVFGLTAPNIFMLDVEPSKIVNLINRINYAANEEVVHDFKLELIALANVDRILIVKPKNECRLDSELVRKSWEDLCNDDSVDGMEARSVVIEFCIQEFVRKIIEYEKQGLHFIVPESRNELADAIVKVLLEKTRGKSLGNSVVRAISRLAQSYCTQEEVKSCSERLIQQYEFEYVFPDRVNVYTVNSDREYDSFEELEEARQADPNVLTDLDKKMLQYFISRKDKVVNVLTQIGGVDKSEVTIFGVDFNDIIYRKPSSILYQVSNYFAGIKGTNNAELLLNVCNSVREELRKYKELIESNVETMGSEQQVDVLSPEKFAELKAVLSGDTVEVFERLFWSGEVLHSDLLTTDFSYYDSIMSMCAGVTPELLNEKFDVQLSRDEWYEQFERVCNFGIYGLNVDGKKLFEDQFSTIIVTNSVKAKITADNFTELQRNISDVEALLDTLLPFGVKIVE